MTDSAHARRVTYRFVPLSPCLLVALSLVVAAGCGSGRGKVSGRVLFKGEPLPGGLVNFRPADPRHNAVTAQLDEEGHYEAVLPVGEVRVSIDNRHLQPPPKRVRGQPKDLPLKPEVRKQMAEAKLAQDPAEHLPPESTAANPSNPPGRYVEIPPRYYEPENSGLEFTVHGGDQEKDFELKK
jgi:hypothetical protein